MIGCKDIAAYPQTTWVLKVFRERFTCDGFLTTMGDVVADRCHAIAVSDLLCYFRGILQSSCDFCCLLRKCRCMQGCALLLIVAVFKKW